MYRIYLFTVVLIGMFCIPLYGQNLVPNPSFEVLESCPDALTGSGFASYQTGVDTIHDYIRLAEPWYCPTTGTSDMIATCATVNAVSVPNNIWGNALASDGENYIALIAYHNILEPWEEAELPTDYTEYVQVMLSEPMIPGEAYRLSFHYRWADDVKFAIDQLGMALTVGELTEGEISDPNPLDVDPQVVTPIGVVNNSAQWQFHLETIVAEEAYDHLTIGRFADFTELTIEQMTTEILPAAKRRAIYFIDEINIVPVGLVGLHDAGRLDLELLPQGIRLGENGDLAIYDLSGKLISQESGRAGDFIRWPNSGSAAAVYVLLFNGEAMKVMNPVYTR